MPRSAALLVALVAVAAQIHGLRDVLLWDDVLLLRRTDLYTNPARWLESVQVPLGYETFYWRPAATTSFLAESMLHGAAAWGFRLTSTLLHGAAAALVVVLLSRRTKSRAVAVAGALVFALHPVNVEPALWPSGRFDLLLALFTLAALASMPRGAARPARWVVPALCAALAFASKESALLLPLVGVLWCEAAGESGRPRWTPAAWLAAGVSATAFLRFEAVGYLFRTRPASVDEAGDALQHVLLMGRAFATSLLTIVWPWGTVGPAHHAERPIPPGDGLGWAGIGLALVVVVATVVALKRQRTVGMLLLLFLVTFAPASQIVPLDLAGGLHSADRYLYLPLVFAVAAGTVCADGLLAARPAWAKRAGAAAAVLLAALLAGRATTIHVWNDPVRFWRRAVEMAPGSVDMLVNLTRAEKDGGDLESAEKHAREAGRMGVPLLVEILVKLDRHRDAREALTSAIEASPEDASLRVQRGEVLLMLGIVPLAAEDFDAAIAIEEARTGPVFAPMLPRALADRAETLARTNEPGRARELMPRAEELANPRDPDTWVRITRAWIWIRDPAKAAAALARARENGAAPQDVDVLGRAISQIAK